MIIIFLCFKKYIVVMLIEINYVHVHYLYNNYNLHYFWIDLTCSHYKCTCGGVGLLSEGSFKLYGFKNFGNRFPAILLAIY